MIVAAFGLVTAVVGLLYLRFSRFAAAGGMGYAGAHITIVDPSTGSEWTSGVPMLVRTVIGSEDPVAEVELWANGERVATSAAAAGLGRRGMFEELRWTPAAAADYLLIARALDPDGHGWDSAAVAIKVVPNPDHAESDSAEGHGGTSMPALGGGSGEAPTEEELADLAPPPGDPTPPPDDAGPDPAEAWAPSLGGLQAWLGQGVSPSPATPYLEAKVVGCRVRLEFYDPMTAELGMVVKRIAPSENSFQTIAILGPHVDKGWMTFDDDAPGAGPNLYEILFFDDVGSALSNQVVATVDPADCAIDLGQGQSLGMGLHQTEGGRRMERLYCYFSLGGKTWARWPSEGFMQADDLNETVQAITGLGAAPLDLELECWEWTEGTLALVGSLHHSLTPISANVEVAFPDGALTLQLVPTVGMTGSLLPSFPGLPVHVRIPAVQGGVTYDPGVCKAHLPPEAQNLLGQVLFCTPFPAYEVGEQPYLIWWVDEGQCLAGSFCLSVPQLLAEAEKGEARVGFHVFHRTLQEPEATMPLDLSAYVVPPVSPYDFYFYGSTEYDPPSDPAKLYEHCGSPEHYSVRLYYEGADGEAAHGPLSPSIPVDTKCMPPSGVTLKVTFTGLTLDHVDDDDLAWETEFVEVYGTFFAVGWGSGGYLNLADWGGHNWCDYNSLDWPRSACPHPMDDGYRNLPGPLCHSSTWETCDGSMSDVIGADSVEVTVRDGDPLKVGVVLIDYDEASDHDEVCVVEVWTAPYSAEQWAAMRDAPFWMYQGDNGHASCEVYWTVTATDVQVGY